MNEEILDAEFVAAEEESTLLESVADKLAIEPGLYRLLQPLTKNDGEILVEADEIVLLREPPSGDSSGLVAYGSKEFFIYGEDTFFSNFEGPLPESVLDDVQAAIQEELKGQRAALADTAHSLAGYSPHVLPSGEVAGTGIVRSDAVSVDDAKKGIKTRANEVEKGALRVQRVADRLATVVQTRAEMLRASIEAHMLAVKEQVKGVQAMLDKAHEALWTINLYLGTEEEIHLIREGHPASETEPIHIQQLVLYMDEECALVDGGVGINAMEVWKFNEWLLADPAHIDAVLPFKKGIVAMRPRRNRDPRSDQMNVFAAVENEEANKATYFLFRNGENLYWMTTKFKVSKHLVPTREEFLSHFEGLTHVGDEQYMDALRRSSGLSNHWLRVGLIIQGIIDRTPVFHPIANRPNILLAGDYGEGVRFVNDAETMIGMGLPPFRDWQREVNARLAVGCRIVGDFGRNYYSDDNLKDRVKPEGELKGGNRPETGALYEIEKTEGGAFVIYFKRRYNKNRASCRLQTYDDFILNIDAVTAEECEAYLSDRASRPDYETMIPVLQAAIKAKREEALVEAPFRRLLKDHTGAQDSEIDELVSWYKFKNKYHRPLAKEDDKAYRMIVAEYPKLKHRQAQLAKIKESAEAFAQWVRQELEGVILVAHTEGREFKVYQRADDYSVYVHESIWSVYKDTYGHKTETRWTTLGNRWKRWNVVWSDEQALLDWNLFPNTNRFLTGPEKEEVYARARKQIDAKYKVLCVRGLSRISRSYYEDYVYDTEAIVWEPGQMKLPFDNLLTGEWVKPKVAHVHFKWLKKGGELTVSTRVSEDTHLHMIKPGKDAPWTIYEGGKGTFDYGNGTAKIYEKDAEAIWGFEDEFRAYNAAQSKRADLAKKARNITEQLETDALQALHDSLYEKYIQEHGDIELWAGYKKTHASKFKLDFNIHQLKDLDGSLDYMLERGISVDGMTVRELIGAFPGFTSDEGEWEPYGPRSKRKVGSKWVTARKGDTPESLMGLKVRGA